MKKNLLKYRKPEIPEGLFCGIGESLDIRFQEQELGQVNTFGELCDLVQSKLPLEKVALCTTRQSFYETVGEAAIAMAHEQYSVWRNNPNRVNHMEVESLIRKAFCEQFAFEPTILTREAHF